MSGTVHCGFSLAERADGKQITYLGIFTPLFSQPHITWLNCSIICYSKYFNFLFWWQSKFFVKFQFRCRFLEEKQHIEITN